MGDLMPAVSESHLQDTPSARTADTEPARDLRSLVAEYERRLILAAVGAAGGCQSKAAVALGVLPTTLCEKMKRLGISRRSSGELPAGAQTVALDARDEFRWRGRLPAGRTLEIKGQRGDVRAVAASGQLAEVVARKSGKSAASQLAINVVEHESGVLFSVFTSRTSTPTLATAVSANLRADFELRIPAGVRLEVRLLAGNIEVVGLGAEVEVSTLSGSVCVRGGAAS
jgi:hypothetical protein